MGAAPTGDSNDRFGRYELLIELAKGGMAELYVGRLNGVGGFAKLVAIKRILPHLAEDKLFAEMFLNEGRIAAQLSHANICQVHELGEADGDLFLAMEYLEGVTWSELAKKLPRDTQTLRLAAGVIAQACEGLHFAHELRDLDGNATPVVHRDVSPQNLFVTTDGTCKVLDFGIAKMLKDGPRTRTGVLKGKLPYMSPEQIQGEEIDARSDVFALGVVLWEALTGKSLFDRETDFLIWKAITEAPIPPLAPFGYPPSIDAVIGSALARDKKLRFRSARALGEALRNAVDPIGGAFDAGEIADVVRLHHGARLVERQREIASAVTRRSQPRIGEPTAADTIEDQAAATADMNPVRTNAGSTVRLRSDAKAVGPTVHPPRSKAPWFIAGAVVLAGAIVAVALTGSSTESPTTPTPTTTTEPVATTPTDLDSVEKQLDQASEQLEAVGKDGRLDKAMEQLDKLSKWGKRAEAMRDSMHPPDPDEPTPTEAAIDEPAPPVEKTTPKTTRKTTPKSTPRSKPTSTPAPVETSEKPTAPVVTGDGWISIASEPYAKIYASGTYLGDTPLKAKIAAGTHELKAVLKDGRSKTFTVEIKVGEIYNAGKLAW